MFKMFNVKNKPKNIKNNPIIIKPSELDVEFYRNSNPDLEGFTNKQLIIHYVNNGKQEGRLPNKPSELDVEFYRNSNPDLEGFTYQQLVIHYVNNGKQEGRRPNDNNNNNGIQLSDYKNVFSKYFLKIKNPNAPIKYDIVFEKMVYDKKMVSIHCNNLCKFENYFKNFVNKFKLDHHIIITYTFFDDAVLNDLKEQINSISLLKICDIGADISNKLITMHHLLNNINVVFKYCVFVHSKTCNEDRNNYILPFYYNSHLLSSLVDSGIDMIVPNYHNICVKNNYNRDTIRGMEKELRELFNFFKIDKDISDFKFNGTNTFALSYKFCESLKPYLNILYNHLNEDNDFDNQWYKLVHNSSNSILENYKCYIVNNHIGNCWKAKRDNLPLLNNNGSYEHLFERFWLAYCESRRFNYFSMPQNIKDFYNIKIYPIYFPQFHNSVENNKFWGEGFTEWSLLKPFPNNITINNKNIPIYKPHHDIGYYSLDMVDTIKNQIKIANQYNIDGFMIYHYWFNNNHSVLNKVEQHIINGNFQFPFYLCWANEPWTQQWEGGGDDKYFIRQEYEDETSLEHINYLIKFFKMNNYVKNSKGECLFYIYNYEDIEKVYHKIMNKWLKILNYNNIKIKIITTSNASPYNQINGTQQKHIFVPAASTKYWEGRPETFVYSDDKIVKKVPFYIECNYFNLIKYYEDFDFRNHHICIPLFWNNIVRKKNKPHLQIENFNKNNLIHIMNVIVTKILLRNKNKLVFQDINKYNIKGLNNYNDLYLDNVLTVNAWNEWNEQAILEPNNVSGYENIQTVCNFFTNTTT
jgi:hypothetical protein